MGIEIPLKKTGKFLFFSDKLIGITLFRSDIFKCIFENLPRLKKYQGLA